ncbi:uncharacterized protein LOC125240497 [Leguminivora glycinivorella]|uniref:uncharacterized protein LOC125240497 n=1 Tax=Leguminivora glycinivorella TaxID=1035111 RepID=UPI00200C3567|nr:uncharacterized protein LOC125240497 [Leguminivora glycinivorella]
MNKVVKCLPSETFSRPSWSIIQNLNLADPDFNVSRPVDLLLGSVINAQIILDGKIKGEDEYQPLAQESQLGWLLSGNDEEELETYRCNIIINNLEEIQQFWEVEDITEEGNLSQEDLECVKHFEEHTKRTVDGRYEVRIPMKPNFQEKLGESKAKAIAQFKHMENKLQKQNKLAEAYKAFMKEYSDLGHMKPSLNNNKVECYLPHHIVERAESLTSKYRVVYNGSSKTSTGYSLNELMYRGPNLQKDIQTLLLKWRQYEFVFCADLEKMFRQILVHEDDQHLQKIIWRDEHGILQSFQLTTVTYGTKSASFLAMMTLKRLARDEQENYPEASKILEESFYMDDLIHGSHSIEQAIKLINDIIDLLRTAGFNLRKWSSNREEVLEHIQNKQDNQNLTINFKQDDISKTLGLSWNPTEDVFTFQCKIEKQKNKPTKRTLLSDISKLFDPLGWLAPLSIKLKILFQKVWKQTVQWDQPIPDGIHLEWSKIQEEIHLINDCKIPRWLLCKQNDVIQLHGYCDASLEAYGCVVYARTEHQTKPILVAAKTKVVPQKKQLTLPKLELCGAHLLSKLMAKIKISLQQHTVETFGWCDSKIVLGWLQGQPSRWKPFVANRVEQIKQVMTEEQWRYVKSSENPADAASRGQTASQLKDNSLWWSGPTWLADFQPEHESCQKPTYHTTEEEKKSYVSNVGQNNNKQDIIHDLLNKYSSITKVTRIVAYILRAFTLKRNRLPSYLTLQELRKAKRAIIKSVQNKELEENIEHLRRNNKVETRSKLFSLYPFLDNEHILRVGGRLEEAHLPYEMRHPKIIPKESRLATLLIEHAHIITLHGGAKITSSKLREEYWVMGGNNRVKQQVRKCVKCQKIDGQKQYQLMGDLPAARVNEAKPFFHTGVDYTGFVDIKASNTRGSRTLKGYIAVFICMVTKAVHLELVTELTSSAFLAALRRMAARKGAPKHLYSDQGTNFIGANNILKQQWKEIQNTFDDNFLADIAEMEIEWHFNAPSWPSAGGLWERAVRSLKHHLKRVVVCRKKRCQWRPQRTPEFTSNSEEPTAASNISVRRRVNLPPPPPPPRASASAASTPYNTRHTSTGDIRNDNKCSQSGVPKEITNWYPRGYSRKKSPHLCRWEENHGQDTLERFRGGLCQDAPSYET